MPITGEITAWAGETTARNLDNLHLLGWLLCNGESHRIQQYPLLSRILAGNFGAGATPNEFRVPDLRGRVIVGVGAGPNLTDRKLAQSFGEETIRLTPGQLPAHDHDTSLAADRGPYPITNPPKANAVFGTQYNTFSTARTGLSGNADPVNVVQPGLALNYLIYFGVTGMNIDGTPGVVPMNF